MLKHKTIFLIVGKSGSGKTTICSELEKQYGMKQIASYTTRPPRYVGEKGHVFVQSMLLWRHNHKGEKMIAYTHFNGYDYWATDRQVQEADLYVVDPAGVSTLLRFYHGPKRVVSIYLDAPWDICGDRMLQRGDKLLQVLKRLWHDRKAFAGWRKKADFVIKSEDLQATVQKVWEVISTVDGHEEVCE